MHDLLYGCLLLQLVFAKTKEDGMGKPLAPGEAYKNRPAGVKPLSLSLEVEAAALLSQLAPTRKSYGRLVSELLRQHATKHNDVRKMQEVLGESVG